MFSLADSNFYNLSFFMNTWGIYELAGKGNGVKSCHNLQSYQTKYEAIMEVKLGQQSKSSKYTLNLAEERERHKDNVPLW